MSWGYLALPTEREGGYLFRRGHYLAPVECLVFLASGTLPLGLVLIPKQMKEDPKRSAQVFFRSFSDRDPSVWEKYCHLPWESSTMGRLERTPLIQKPRAEWLARVFLLGSEPATPEFTSRFLEPPVTLLTDLAYRNVIENLLLVFLPWFGKKLCQEIRGAFRSELIARQVGFTEISRTEEQLTRALQATAIMKKQLPTLPEKELIPLFLSLVVCDPRLDSSLQDVYCHVIRSTVL